MGVGIEEMRIYQSNRELGRVKAGEQRDLLLRHAERVEAEIKTLHIHLDYLRAKAALWEPAAVRIRAPKPRRTCRSRK